MLGGGDVAGIFLVLHTCKFIVLLSMLNYFLGITCPSLEMHYDYKPILFFVHYLQLVLVSATALDK